MKGCLKLSQISKLLFPLKLFNKVECILHFLLVFIDILFFMLDEGFQSVGKGGEIFASQCDKK